MIFSVWHLAIDYIHYKIPSYRLLGDGFSLQIYRFVPGDIPDGQSRFVAGYFLQVSLPTNHQSTTAETCDSSGQTELRPLSLMWHLYGYTVRKQTFLYLLIYCTVPNGARSSVHYATNRKVVGLIHNEMIFF
jgi:hypothetical protein